MTSRHAQIMSLSMALSGLACAPPPEADAGDATDDVESSELAAQIEAPDQEMVDIPGGRAHPSCIHEVPDGAEIDAHRNVIVDGRKVSTLPRCRYRIKLHGRGGSAASPPTAADGWLMDISATSGFGKFFNRLDGHWTVPRAPRSSRGRYGTSQVFYLFNGLETAAGDRIIQPVLHYGYSPAGGGQGWYMASWYVSTTAVVAHSPLAGVSPGTEVYGQMYTTSCPDNTGTNCSYAVTISHDGVVKGITAGGGHGPYTVAFKAVMEQHNLGNCTELPQNYPNPGYGYTSFNDTLVYTNPFNGSWRTRVDVSLSLNWTGEIASDLPSLTNCGPMSLDGGYSNSNWGTFFWNSGT